MPKVPSIAEELNTLFPAQWIRRTARAHQVVQRVVKVDVVVFFWTVLLGPPAGAFVSLASLQRRFEAAAAITLARSSFLDRFSKALVRFLEACLDHAMEHSLSRWASPPVFERFRDVLVQDSTAVTVADTLARFFPGVKTKAAVKVNAVSSVQTGSIRALAISGGTRGETRFARITRRLEGHLLLLDLGYFSWSVFSKIDRVGAFYVSRLKGNANPRIVRDLHRGAGRRRPVVGLKLRDVLKKLKRQELDVEVEVSFTERRRPTKMNPRKTIRRTARLRVVGVRHPDTGTFHLYVTNLSPEELDPEQVRAVYSARWFGELLFRELKSNCQLRRLPSRKPHVVRALILAAAIRLMVARVALETIRCRYAADARRRFPSGFDDFVEVLTRLRTTPERFHAVWRDLSPFFLLDVLRSAGVGWRPKHLDDLLAAAVIDPNRSRDSLWWRLSRA